jgi:hypothetical protein
MAARFGGRVSSATFTKQTNTGIDPADPAGAPLSSAITYTCDAYAFSVDAQNADGVDVARRNYDVMILRGTIKNPAGVVVDVIPGPQDLIECPPPGGSVAVRARVGSVSPITEAFCTAHVVGE